MQSIGTACAGGDDHSNPYERIAYGQPPIKMSTPTGEQFINDDHKFPNQRLENSGPYGSVQRASHPTGGPIY